MSNPNVIAPYEPTEENWFRPSGSPPLTDLRIDPVIYQAALLLQWPLAEVGGMSAQFPLSWFLYVRAADGTTRAIMGEGMLCDDLQTVLVKHPCPENLLWHRSFVPLRYPLYFSASDPGWHIELIPGMTLQEISDRTGVAPYGSGTGESFA